MFIHPPALFNCTHYGTHTIGAHKNENCGGGDALESHPEQMYHVIEQFILVHIANPHGTGV